MKRFKLVKLMVMAIFVILIIFLVGCSGTSKERVVIFSSSESQRNERFQEMLNNKFPDYDIIIESIPTGENVARILAEGQNTECDIMFDIEHSFMEKLLGLGVLADVSNYDTSMFLDDFQPTSNEYLPWSRFSTSITLNIDVLRQRGLAEPESWNDLLKPEYKGLISMPNPKTSGTGYIYLKFLVNKFGEEEAFAYFDELAKNILQFTASGSGPTNALLKNEVAIGLGLTYQAAIEIENGAPFKITFFDGGAPHSSTSCAIIKKSADRKAVKEVMEYIYSEILEVDNIEFMPEKGLKISKNTNPYFPEVFYGDMSNNTEEEKERLISKWRY